MKLTNKIALIQSIETLTNLIGFSIADNDMSMIDTFHKDLKQSVEILKAIECGKELDSMQELILRSVYESRLQLQKESEAQDSEALTYQGSNENIEKDGSELKAVKIKDLVEGEFFILSSKSKSVFVKSDYDRSLKQYECSNFDNFSDYRYYKGNKIVFTGFTF
jgi:hypothetical protein